MREGKDLVHRLRPYAFIKAVSAGMYIPDISDRGTFGNILLRMKEESFVDL